MLFEVGEVISCVVASFFRRSFNFSCLFVSNYLTARCLCRSRPLLGTEALNFLSFGTGVTPKFCHHCADALSSCC